MNAPPAVGARVRVKLDETWVGPMVQQLHGSIGTVAQIESKSFVSAMIPPAALVKLDEPVGPISELWLVPQYIEAVDAHSG